MNSITNVKRQLVAAAPSLRAFAIYLSGRHDKAYDLVQETFIKAWSHLDYFADASNVAAKLITMLREVYYSDYRKRQKEGVDTDGTTGAKLASPPARDGHIDFFDFCEIFQQLPADQREALVLVGAAGVTYEMTAQICSCPVESVKSRVILGRTRLAELLSVPSPIRQCGIELGTTLPRKRAFASELGDEHAQQPLM